MNFPGFEQKGESYTKPLAKMANFREQVFDIILKSATILGIPALIFGLIKLASIKEWKVAPIYIFFYLFILSGFYSRKFLSYKVRFVAMVICTSAISLILLIRFGFSGAGGWFFIALCVLSTVLMDVKWGIITIAIGTLSFIGVGYGFVNGIIGHDTLIMSNSLSTLSWTIASILFVTIGIMVVLPFAALQNILLKSMSKLETRKEELEVKNQDLNRQIKSRIHAEERAEKLKEQLLHSQKMEAVGRLAGGIAHDFNNMLTGISGNVSLAQMDIEDNEDINELLDEVSKAAKRASDLTSQLLAFSRKQLISPKVICINDRIKRMLNMSSRIIGEDIEVKTFFNDDIGNVYADPGQIEQVILNLVINARDAMEKGGVLILETNCVTLTSEFCQEHVNVSQGKYVRITVKDTGSGIDEDIKEHVFEPFFTTKEQGKGTGLGLATSYGIIRQHNGFINFETDPELGTSFFVYLPVVDKPVDKKKKSRDFKDLPQGNETILVVEDEDMVRKVATKVLSKQKYNVLEADSGAKALEIVENYEGKIDLLLTDVIMPKINGHELALKINEMIPDIKVLYTSGYTEDVIADHGILEEGLEFIGKPYATHDLLEKLRKMLDEPTN